jgi:hypothetical protein
MTCYVVVVVFVVVLLLVLQLLNVSHRFSLTPTAVQSAFHEKVPVGWGVRALVLFGGKYTCGCTKGLLLVENSMTHQGVTLLYTD